MMIEKKFRAVFKQLNKLLSYLSVEELVRLHDYINKLLYSKYKVNVLDVTVPEARYWYKDGALHRHEGPAVERGSGGEEWWLNGKRHRKRGPAITNVFEGQPSTAEVVHQQWFQHGKLHREDGPAILYFSGREVYALDNMQMSYDEWKKQCQEKREN